MGANNFPTLFEDLNLSGLATVNPGGGKPWLRPDNALGVGTYTPIDLSSRVAKAGDTMVNGATLNIGAIGSDGVLNTDWVQVGKELRMGTTLPITQHVRISASSNGLRVLDYSGNLGARLTAGDIIGTQFSDGAGSTRLVADSGVTNAEVTIDSKAMGYFSIRPAWDGNGYWRVGPFDAPSYRVRIENALELQSPYNPGTGARAQARIKSTDTVAAFRIQNTDSGYTLSRGLGMELVNTVGYLWNYEAGPLILAANNATALTLASTGATFANGIILDSTARIFSQGTLAYQSNNASVQHSFTNQIGATLTGTVVEINTGNAGAASGVKLLSLKDVNTEVASVSKAGAIDGSSFLIQGSLAIEQSGANLIIGRGFQSPAFPILLGNGTGTVRAGTYAVYNLNGNPYMESYSNVGIQARTAGGADGTFRANEFQASGPLGGYFYFAGRGMLTSSANGIIHVQNFYANDSVAQALVLGPGTSSTNGVRLTKATGSSVLTIRNGNDTANADFVAGLLTGSGLRITTSTTPATSGAAGVTGTIAWDASFLYVCTATNTWKRAAIATW